MKATDFQPAEPGRGESIRARLSEARFPAFLGLRYEEIRRDYARMRLPYRPELDQPAGVIHGGAIAALIDSAVVGAILSGIDGYPRKLVTIDMHVAYLDSAVQEDLVAEARVRRRGRSTVFLEVEVRATSGEIAHGELVYRVSV